MKLKDNFLSAVAILLTVMMGVTACGNDIADGNEEPGADSEGKISASGLLGMWRCDWGDDSTRDYTAYYFEKKDEYDGQNSGVSFDKGNGGVPFDYTFNESTQTVDIVYTEYSRKTLYITDFKSNTIQIDGKRYDRSELTKEMILLGEWLLHITTKSNWMSRVTFYSDGTYAAIDCVESTELDTSFYSFGDRVVYGRYYIDNKNITFTGNSDIAGDYIIDGLVINGMRLIRIDYPDEYPYIIGEWANRL